MADNLTDDKHKRDFDDYLMNNRDWNFMHSENVNFFSKILWTTI